MRGDACPYAHNVFEYWLHPTRYRTQLCNDGEKCARKICFFAHTLEELRVPANKPFVPQRRSQPRLLPHRWRPRARRPAAPRALPPAPRWAHVSSGGHAGTWNVLLSGPHR